SSTLDGINGYLDKHIWSNYIKKTLDKISTAKKFNREDFDEISDAEMLTLKTIHESFGFMTASQLRNYTHKHFPEYTDIEHGRIPINYFDIFKILGLNEAEYLADEVNQFRKTEALLAR